MPAGIFIRSIQSSDCPLISEAFHAQGWHKPVEQYERYVRYQQSGERDVLIAEVAETFAGYLTINWISDYRPFQQQQIPEIVDFNVLKKFQRQGIGTLLMDEAERRIKRVSPIAGIGYGLYADYGPAQILYSKRHYLPDGKGLIKNGHPILPGTQVRIDDSVVLYLTKVL